MPERTQFFPHSLDLQKEDANTTTTEVPGDFDDMMEFDHMDMGEHTQDDLYDLVMDEMMDEFVHYPLAESTTNEANESTDDFLKSDNDSMSMYYFAEPIEQHSALSEGLFESIDPSRDTSVLEHVEDSSGKVAPKEIQKRKTALGEATNTTKTIHTYFKPLTEEQKRKNTGIREKVRNLTKDLGRGEYVRGLRKISEAGTHTEPWKIVNYGIGYSALEGK